MLSGCYRRGYEEGNIVASSLLYYGYSLSCHNSNGSTRRVAGEAAKVTQVAKRAMFDNGVTYLMGGYAALVALL